MFPLFHKYTSKVIEGSSKMPLGDVLQLQVALVNFATKVYPERMEYIDNVLGFSNEVLKKTGAPKVETKCVKHVIQLLTLPLDSLGLRILDLEGYGPLMEYLEWDERKKVSVTMSEAIVKLRAPLDTATKVMKLFGFIAPLIKDEGETKGGPIPESDRFEFDTEQHLVARLFQNVHSDDTDTHFKLYAAARKHFGRGGTQRIETSLPPLVFGSMALVQRVKGREDKKEEMQVKSKKVFGFIHETISVLSPHYPDLALRLFLQAAMTADVVGFEAISYEFVTQAFLVYEDEISDSKQQLNAISYIAACLHTFRSFGKENYDTLATKATGHSLKLLKKIDQCRAVYNCSHLFWPGDDEHPGHRDEKRVLSCLQKSLKIANNCMQDQVLLFVEILNKYLYFFDRGCPSITVKYLKGLIRLIKEHIPNLDGSDPSHQIARTHFQNTLAHVKEKQSGGDELAERYSAIDDEEDFEPTPTKGGGEKDDGDKEI